MNKKAQMEFNPGAVLMAVLGFFVALIMAGKMGAGIGLKILSVILTTVVCYFMANAILNN